MGINNNNNNNNNNNKRINDDYGRHQDLILLFKIPTGTHPQKVRRPCLRV